MTEVNHELLRARRDELDMSNADLAERLGLSYGYVANILGGRDRPSRRVLLRFERVLELKEGAAAGSSRPQGDPSEPPQQPKNEPTSPPPRRDKKAGTAPRRVDDRAAL